ncbi:hypothetical protein SNK03_008179 [Fusarium graminearum]|nr:unnamed protein product [Fusarium graminearum]CAG1965231.1 unnamed protein product [Fusarium graminearum]CAG1979558.1 unnamed protein product [Fusarium graminearum]VTO85418.1 unnamed protein product [Fusarium graminearum]
MCAAGSARPKSDTNGAMELSMPSMFRAYAILWYLRDGGVDSFRARSQSLTRWRELAKTRQEDRWS